MPAATYRVEVAWSTNLVGVVVLGTSTLGGTDVLAGAFGHGAYDDLTDAVREIVIRRGRTDDLGQMGPGTCTLVLRDTNGTYNPANAGSPLAADLVPMRPLRVQADHGGVTYGLFQGYIQSIESRPALDEQQAIIEAADLQCWLQQARPVIASTGATTTGGAIGAVLDAVGFTDGSLRALDTGDALSDFSTDGSKSALAVIQELAAAERGVFFLSGRGVATYEDRMARFRSPRDADQTDLGDSIKSPGSRIAVDQVINEWRITRTGGTEQAASDTSSVNRYGRRSNSLSTGYLADDAAALYLARYLVYTTKDPKAPLTLSLDNGSDATLTAILARDLSDRVAVSESRGGTAGSWHLEHVEQAISAGGTRHEAAWLLSKRPAWTPFVVGTSTLGGTHVLTY